MKSLGQFVGAVAIAGLSGHGEAADLPVPCAAGACGGGPDVFVTSGKATYSVAGSVGTIEQLTDRAILNWQQFNVANGAQVVFKQPRDISVALNRIYDQSPSQILGAVTANGQIYLVNPNGMIFGANARVNVNTLIASSLDVPDSVFNGAGLAGAINQGGGVAALSATKSALGDIDVAHGAVLQTADGGRIFIFAPRVVNEGTITTPGGQTILGGAKDKVYLEFSTDPSVRGFLIEVGTGGEATNLGEIIAERGNITMAGILVRQQGVLSATTTVRENGSIRLLARDNVATIADQTGNHLITRNAGELDIGAGSTTTVLPDSTSDLTAVDSQAQQPSSIELMGKSIDIGAGAQLVATGGEITATATLHPNDPLHANTPQNAASLTIDANARLDVSGDTSTVVPMSRNQVNLDLRSNELADSPLQRGGVLQGQNVSVDARVGTPVANVSQAIANIKRGIDERLSTGGTITLGSEGTMQIAQGSVLDVSGGSVTYQSGTISTTKLVTNGHVVDIGAADPNAKYSAVFSGTTVKHPDWGVTENFADPTGLANTHWEAGYVEGKDAGSLSIVAHDLTMDGQIRAGTTVGANQRLPTMSLSGDPLARPYQQLAQRGAVTLTLNSDIGTLVDVTLGDSSQFDHGVLITPETIEQSGLGSFSLKTYGAFAFASDAHLDLAGGSSFSVSAGSVEWDGALVSPSGTVQITSKGASAGNAPTTIGATASIDVAGWWVNDDPATKPTSLAPTWIDGGKITVASGGDFIMQLGSMLDVSGGAWLDATGNLTAGVGGTISLASRAGIDTKFLPQAGLRGFALQQGGTLRFEANALALYDAPPDEFIQPPVFVPTPTGPTENPFPLDFLAKIDATIPNFFLQLRGFENYEFVSNRYGTIVVPGAQIYPVQRNFILSAANLRQPSGRYLRDFASIGLLPIQQRRPANLTLAYERDIGSSPSGSVVVMSGASIATDIGGSIDLTSEGSLRVQGTLFAPAGSIRLAIDAPTAATFPFVPNQVLWVDSTAALLAPGVFRPQFDSLGRTRGDVLPGGDITLDAEQGFVVTEAGSVFDVGGTAKKIDITRTATDLLTPTWVGSDSGSIEITVAEGGLIDGTFRAQNARPDVAGPVRGGSIEITLDPNQRRIPQGEDELNGPGIFPVVDRNLVVTDAVDAPSFAFGDAVPTDLLGREEVSIAKFANSGFDSLKLSVYEVFPVFGRNRGADAHLTFDSNVDASFGRFVGLNAPSIEGAPGTSVSLSAPLASVGYDFLGTGTSRTPVIGTSQLSIAADALDLIGHVIVSGFAQTSFDIEGDVRLRGVQPDVATREYDGSLNVAGNLTLAANRVFPTTLTQYSIDVTGDPNALLTIGSRGADPDSPLFSVGGSLTLGAPNIDIEGRVYAPQGSLTLDAANDLHVGAGARLSVALEDDVTLFGRTQAGIDWIYPFPSQRLQIIDRLPDKAISLQGANVSLDSGSTVDLSGGGKVLAYEFTPGPGGSKDVLDPANAGGTFVILPLKNVALAPYDPLESNGFAYAEDTGVQLGAVAGLAAGEYAVLPARYALLPGAMLVTPVAGTVDMVPGEVRYGADGAPIVAGRFTVLGTSEGDSRYTGFKIQPGAFAQQQASYVLTDANKFFAGRVGNDGLTSSIPNDGGDLSVAATSGLAIDGTLAALGASGARAGSLGLIADRIAVVADRSVNVAGYVGIAASDLDAARVGSVVIGGVAQRTATGVDLDVRASSVLIDDNVDLERPELVLAATSDVTVDAGATIAAVGSSDQAAQTLTLGAGAAALAVSTRQVDIVRTDNGGAGRLVLADGSTVSATGSLDVSVAADAVLGGTLTATGASFALDAQRLALGDGQAATGETRIGAAQLAALGADALRFSSREGLGVYGDVAVDAPTIALFAPGIVRATDDGALSLSGDSVVIGNPARATLGTAPVATSGGLLSITAREVDLADGPVEVRGFALTNVVARSALIGSGDAQLHVGGDLTVATSMLTTGNGASLTITGDGAVEIDGPPAPASSAAAASNVGGEVRVSGQRVSVATAVIAPSGLVELDATGGDVELRAGARLDASGVSVVIGDHTVASDGGSVALSSASGNVVASAGSSIAVAAGGSAAKAGAISLAAPLGNVDVASAIVGGSGGSFAADGATLVDVGGLNARVEAAGFDAVRSYRQRTGDLAFDATTMFTANSLALDADQGALVVDGVVELVGADPTATLSAGTGVSFGGRLHAANAARVTVNALASGGTIAFAPTAVVDVGGGAVRLRVRDDGTAGQRIALPAAPVNGALGVDLVTFYAVADGTFDASDQVSLRALLDASNARLDGVHAALPGAALSLSTMITSPGALTVTDALDLVDWRFGDLPGTLAFRSGGDLNLMANINDGFAATTFQFEGEDIPVLRPIAGPSYGYAFVAGADARSADPLATTHGVGNVTIGPATRIRTGSGDVDIRAGGSLVFAGADSHLYTGGETDGNGFDDVFSYAYLHDVQFPTHGGAIDIAVGGNVVGAPTRQLISQYMARFGGSFFDQSAPTMYGVVFDYNFGPDPFGQNIGSFGGGAVRISAGGDVRDLSVIVPETLQPAGTVTAVFDPFSISASDNSVTRHGATTLDVSAHGDIVGGLYYLGGGTATLTAGSIVRPTSGPGLMLATSDASFHVSARGDAYVEAMFNPTMLPQDPTLQLSAETSYFFSYSDSASLDVRSLTGTVTFGNDTDAIRNSVDYSSETRAERVLNIYPSRVSAIALAGDIAILHGMTLYPGAGGFQLLAASDVTGPANSLGTLYVPDTDPASLPSIATPQPDLVGTDLRLPASGQADAALIHAATPVHAGDTTPSEIVAANGSIDAPLLAIVSGEALQISSHADIDIGRVEAQNVNSTDVTSVVSGGDITIRSQRNPDTGQVITNSKVIRVGGGGQLQVVAGKSVDLGSSEGLQTSGNLDNPALPSGGADILVITGAAGDPQLSAFIDRYLVQSSQYSDALIQFVEARTGTNVTDAAQAVALLRAQPVAVQSQFLTRVFFAEIKASGIAAAELIAQKAPAADVQNAYARGRTAISTLFPDGRPYGGDLRLFFSQIASLDGGNIQLVVPGGIVNAGLATTSISSKKPSELGIVAQRAGSIDVYASGDVQVNQSRVFTLAGGDIDMWSNTGNIDAGKGAKTALSAPGLSVVLGENDSVEKIVPPDISGSGIAAAAGPEGELPDIVLSTPNGFVDAGDAGIRTPGRLFTAATEFLGRDNVDVGSFVGAPVGTVTLSADLAGVGNSATSASQNIAQAAVDDSKTASSVSQSVSQSALGWLEVFLEGYGDEQCDPASDPKCRTEKTQ